MPRTELSASLPHFGLILVPGERCHVKCAKLTGSGEPLGLTQGHTLLSGKAGLEACAWPFHHAHSHGTSREDQEPSQGIWVPREFRNGHFLAIGKTVHVPSSPGGGVGILKVIPFP